MNRTDLLSLIRGIYSGVSFTTALFLTHRALSAPANEAHALLITTVFFLLIPIYLSISHHLELLEDTHGNPDQR